MGRNLKGRRHEARCCSVFTTYAKNIKKNQKTESKPHNYRRELLWKMEKPRLRSPDHVTKHGLVSVRQLVFPPRLNHKIARVTSNSPQNKRRILAPRTFSWADAAGARHHNAPHQTSARRTASRNGKTPRRPRTFRFARTFITTQATRKPGQQLCTSTRADG